MSSRILKYEECPICGELIPDYPFSDPRCEKCMKEEEMKEWDSDSEEYVDQDDKPDDGEVDSIKLKAKGSVARKLADVLLTGRKKKAKKNNGVES